MCFCAFLHAAAKPFIQTYPGGIRKLGWVFNDTMLLLSVMKLQKVMDTKLCLLRLEEEKFFSKKLKSIIPSGHELSTRTQLLRTAPSTHVTAVGESADTFPTPCEHT